MNDVATESSALALPQGTRTRLRSFYGPSVNRWLNTVMTSIERAARGWRVILSGCHDRGWTSVIAHGLTSQNQPVIIKAVPDPGRYRRELMALQHWNGRAANSVLASDNDACLLLLAMIGPTPGGAPRPADHEIRTALRLSVLHESSRGKQQHVPDLRTEFARQLRPQISGSALLNERIGPDAIATIVRLGAEALKHDPARVMLHGDLYAENVVFDIGGHPTFIDPRGMTGPPSYDWAFWCVFYLDEGFERRLAMLDRLDSVDRGSVLPWIAVITADRLRHHLESRDADGAARLQTILATGPVRSLIGH